MALNKSTWFCRCEVCWACKRSSLRSSLAGYVWLPYVDYKARQNFVAGARPFEENIHVIIPTLLLSEVNSVLLGAEGQASALHVIGPLWGSIPRAYEAEGPLTSLPIPSKDSPNGRHLAGYPSQSSSD